MDLNRRRDRHAGSQKRWGDKKQTDRQTDRQEGREIGRQAGR